MNRIELYLPIKRRVASGTAEIESDSAAMETGSRSRDARVARENGETTRRFPCSLRGNIRGMKLSRPRGGTGLPVGSEWKARQIFT